jgi:hypothetical protein
MANTLFAAKAGQQIPQGFYNVERVLRGLLLAIRRIVCVRHLPGSARIGGRCRIALFLGHADFSISPNMQRRGVTKRVPTPNMPL